MTAGTLTRFRSGDIVEVRSFDEIRATLDANGAFEGVAFMEEMRRFCGRTLRVFKRADKVCVENAYFLDLRRMRNAVLLEEVRCDGSQHDGCKRMCLIFWKEAWLKPAATGASPEEPPDWVSLHARSNGATPRPIDPAKTYSCQATQLQAATEQLRIWDPRHYLRDLRTRAIRPRDMLLVLFTTAYNKIARSRKAHDFGKVVGTNQKTPAVSLGLRPGEFVRIKSKQEIASTLDTRGKNRGLAFGDLEMARHCGRTFPVLARIDRMILEDCGKMKAIQNTVLLQGTTCSGLCFRGCARNGHGMWREAWLERVGTSGAPDA